MSNICNKVPPCSKDLEHKDIFKKGVYTLKNDLYYQFFENKDSRWFFDICYKPIDLPSGDGYSIRQVGDERFLVFVVDAMGKGLTASITSIMTCSFINYLIDKCSNCSKQFDLEAAIKEYHRYIKQLMFPDEVVSISFLLIDFKYNYLQSAIFGMPPILIQHNDGSIHHLIANNIPLTNYTTDINLNTIDLKDVNKLLIYSDGLNETIIDNSHMYKDYLVDDFKNSINYRDFLQTILKKVGSFDDDMTYLYIKKADLNNYEMKNITIKSYMSELDIAIKESNDFFVSHGINSENEAYLINAFSEVLINAYEHGNLRISHNEKSSHLELGTFDELICHRESLYGEQKININLYVKYEEVLQEQSQKIFKIEVEDKGNGFNTDIMKNRMIKNETFSGRGLLMISKMVDAFYYNSKGNKVLLKKFQKKGDNS